MQLAFVFLYCFLAPLLLLLHSFPQSPWKFFLLCFCSAMLPSISWYPVVSLAISLFVLEPSQARLDGPHSYRHHRPGLLSDLKTAWGGLLSYSPPDLLLARNIENVSTSQSASVRCTIGSNLSASPLRGSSPSASIDAPPTATSNSSGLPSSIWKIKKDHVSTKAACYHVTDTTPFFSFLFFPVGQFLLR